mmetsp:Transcript_2688/g.3665  ORF Transcript_2688/g.3665 Transcript_2688/m.3665 type:complete len:480 (+) Transcript_2688:157-1596(+)
MRHRLFCPIVILTIFLFLLHIHLHWWHDEEEKKNAKKEDERRLHPVRSVQSMQNKTSNVVKRMRSRVHVVFSTDCSEFQHWQSLVLLDSAMRVEQRGVITRLISGCTNERKKQMEKEMQALAKKWPFYFHSHYTPDYNRNFHNKRNFRFANKPHAVLHWLDHHGDEFRENHAHFDFDDEEIILVLIDPDFIFLRPLDLWTLSGAKTGNRWDDLQTAKQLEGKPAAQSYGLGAAWLKFNLTAICSPNPTNCLQVTPRLVSKHYNCGPPYISHWRDLRRIAQVWVEFTPKFYQAYPTVDGPNRDSTRHYAEMYAYVAAAAHLQLPHRLPSNLISGCMVDWRPVDLLPKDSIKHCGRISSNSYHDAHLPFFIHYCQRHALGPYRFSKRQVPHDILSCPSSQKISTNNQRLLNWSTSPTPPADLFSNASYYAAMYGLASMHCGGRCSMSLPPEKEARRVAFIICHLHAAINGAHQSNCNLMQS